MTKQVKIIRCFDIYFTLCADEKCVSFILKRTTPLNCKISDLLNSVIAGDYTPPYLQIPILLPLSSTYCILL